MKMNRSRSSTSFFVFSIVLHFLSAQSHNQHANSSSLIDNFFRKKIPPMGMPGPLKGSIPALYVFGDSLLDSGNNNYLNTKAKANFPPFGVDFIDHVATGRFTNGRTMADFIAQLTGLPFPPPLLSFSKGENITTGVNYASGSSGILHNTGKSEGTCLYFDKQIDLFQTTIEVGLKLLFKKPEELSSHLSKSLFLIDVGSNDLLGFLRNLGPAVLANPTVLFGFTQSLSNHLADRLQRLYNLGARKFLVVNIGPIGCTPGMLSMMGKSFSTTLQSECFEGFNAFLDMYNSKLPLLLKKLQSTLSGSVFVHVNANRMTLETLLKPTKFGIVDAWNSCFQNDCVCKDRNQHFYFDTAHPTEAIHYLLTKRCFYDSSICSPINLKKLLCSSS